MTTLDLFDRPPPPEPERAPSRPSRATDPTHWFTIPPHRAFLPDVAAGLHRTLAAIGPEGLAEAVVLTPTRRTARALAEAFVDAAAGQATLLPQIRTLGDLDTGEAPFEPGDIGLHLRPAVTPLRRRCELARIVVANQHVLKRDLDAAAALSLADALAAFLDAVQIEEAPVTPGALAALAPEELAGHWQVSADVLALALRDWPLRLRELGLMDVAERRVAILRALAEHWWERPPTQVLVAAGVQGDAPAADLLAAVAAAPRGAVILPGLDLDLADDAWDAIGDDHPQGAMKGLLQRVGLARAQIQPWPLFGETAVEAAVGRARRRVLSEALRPPAKTDEWLSTIADIRAEGAAAGVDPIAEGLQGLGVLCAANEEAAAGQAALLLREALEIPGRTAALVTPDPALARRVSARLARWGIVVDSSAGLPLDRTPVGALVSMMAALAAEPTDPALLLSVSKHSLARLGRPTLELDAARRDLEKRALRGPRTRGWAELLVRLEGDPDPAKRRPGSPAAAALVRALQAAVEHAQAPFLATSDADPIQAVRALAESLELVAADEKGAPGELWAGADGEQAASLVAGLIQDADGLPRLTLAGFAELMAELARGEVVRTGGAGHPRLRILGLIEARLNRADVTVLAGLEEGAWPPAAATDPLLSRGMRKTLGLPSPERRIGAAAHDFAQAACAPAVTLITSERRGGSPATRSRWLWRLQMLSLGAGLDLPGRPEIAAWAQALEAPLASPPAALKLADRPKPKPPASVRPRRLAATRVEEWIRDPYATYARYVLGLTAMDPPDAPLEARARGVAIHAAFERFALEHPDEPWGSAEAFEGMLLEALSAAGLPEHGHARERPLARRLGAWAAGLEQARRPGAELLIEKEGVLTFTTADGEFTLTAKADRLEVRADRIDVIDFKSGGVASKKEVAVGLAPQLTLTAAIAQAGGFEGAPALPPGELAYAKVTGRKVAGVLDQRVEGEAAFHAARALERLKHRVEAFEAETTPYLAKQQPKFISADGRGDYDHLMRLWEWRVVGEGDDAAEEGGAGA